MRSFLYRSKGVSCRVDLGIAHCIDSMIIKLFSASQLVKSCVNNPEEVLISSLNLSILKPPSSSGRDQLIMTSSKVSVSVGAKGYDGTVAAMIEKTSEYSLKPIPFRAFTLNL